MTRPTEEDPIARATEEAKRARHVSIAIERAARTAHEVNRAYIDALDESSAPWDKAPNWLKDSVRSGVLYLMTHPHATPAEQHEEWLVTKRADGWKYGPVKDPEKREHPCFLPYEELPDPQKAKDAIFAAVVRGVLKHHGVI